MEITMSKWRWIMTNLFFTGQKQSRGCKTDDMYDVSLICEEDLLTTIFHACDIQRTGLVLFVAVFPAFSQYVFKTKIMLQLGAWWSVVCLERIAALARWLYMWQIIWSCLFFMMHPFPSPFISPPPHIIFAVQKCRASRGARISDDQPYWRWSLIS